MQGPQLVCDLRQFEEAKQICRYRYRFDDSVALQLYAVDPMVQDYNVKLYSICVLQALDLMTPFGDIIPAKFMLIFKSVFDEQGVYEAMYLLGQCHMLCSGELQDLVETGFMRALCISRIFSGGQIF